MKCLGRNVAAEMFGDVELDPREELNARRKGGKRTMHTGHVGQ